MEVERKRRNYIKDMAIYGRVTLRRMTGETKQYVGAEDIVQDITGRERN